MSSKLELGKTYRCNVTGFQGVAVSRCESLSSPDEYLIQPRLDKDGKPQESRWVWATRLEEIRLPQ